MRKQSILIALILTLFHLGLSAQYAEPALGGADYSCDPCGIGEVSELSFNWANSGSSSIPAGSVEIVVSFPSQYYRTDGITLPVGAIAGWFDWAHNTAAGGDTWVGTLNRAVPAFDGGEMAFEVRGILMSSAPENTTIFTQPISDFGMFLNSPDNDNLTPGAKIEMNLPIELISFDAILNDCVNTLNWFTASETELSHFEVEVSNDGVNFTTGGRVDATGGANTAADYSFTDDQLKEVNYYRLKIVNLDGSVEYTEMITIYADCASGVFVSEVFPNPVKTGTINVRFNSNLNHTDAHLVIMDALGRDVMEIPVTINPGSNLVSVDPSRLPAAPYFLVIQGAGWKTASAKFVKMSE